MYKDRFYNTKEWRTLSERVVERDDGTCQYCGDAGTRADHVMPRRHGGVDSVSNLVCSCNRCNLIASDLVFFSFHAKQRYIVQKITSNKPMQWTGSQWMMKPKLFASLTLLDAD